MPISSVGQVVFRAHGKQLRFLRSRARLVAFVGGAGSGKTTAGVIWTLQHAASWPGSRGMMIARSYPQLKQSMLVELERWGRDSRLDEVWQFNRQDMEVRLPNGSRFWLRSADRPDSLLGADLAWIYGDEVALWDEAAFKYSISRLRQPGFMHQAAFTFTPKGRNWAYDVFGRPRADLSVEVIQASTRDNFHLDPGFLAMLEEQYGDTPFARQEIDGEFVSFEGLVYPCFALGRHVRCAPDERAFTSIVAGVDWGFTSPGAIVVVGHNEKAAAGEAEFCVLDEVYERNIAPDGTGECWVSIAARLKQRWGIGAFFCDPSQPGNIDAFVRAGLRAKRADNAIEPGIARVSGLLASERLFIAPGCKNLIEELGRYAYETDRDGRTTGQVKKTHDHAADALRYAVVGLQSRQPSRAFVQAV
jgi:PBSX family phage terminase large subunit